VPPGASFPPRSLVLGAPATVKRALTDEEVASIRRSAASYVTYASEHRAAGSGGA
jgi:carbonic anhydrase/acetyltransferase-like protein (isoleucine patch superfamily)